MCRCEIDWQAAHVGGIDLPAALELCSEFGFHSLPKRLGRAVRDVRRRRSGRAQYETVATEAGLRELVATLRRQKRIAVDTETTSAHARWAELVGLFVCLAAGTRRLYSAARAAG